MNPIEGEKSPERLKIGEKDFPRDWRGNIGRNVSSSQWLWHNATMKLLLASVDQRLAHAFEHVFVNLSRLGTQLSELASCVCNCFVLLVMRCHKGQKWIARVKCTLKLRIVI